MDAYISLLLQYAIHDCKFDERGGIFGAGFFNQIFSVSFNSSFAGKSPVSDFHVGISICNEGEYFNFSIA